MSADGSAGDARARLDEASRLTLDSGADRRRFATVLAGLGVALGGATVGDRLLDGHEPWHTLLACAALAGLLWVVLSGVRGRTTPRGSTTAGWWGLGASVSVSLVVAWAFGADVLSGPAGLVVGGVAVALPLLVAAGVVARGGRA